MSALRRIFPRGGGAAAPASDATLVMAPAPDGPAAELTARRDVLAERFAQAQWDLGGLAYEMARRDHFRLDVLVRAAARLQEVDAELAEAERLLRLEEAAAAGRARPAARCTRAARSSAGSAGAVDRPAAGKRAGGRAMSPDVADVHAGAPTRVLDGADASAVSERCPGCATPLAGDERFCIACGLRVAPDELRLAALPLLAAPGPPLGPPAGPPAFRRPVVRSAAITAVVVLVFGIAIGATIGPAAVGETAAAQRPVVLVAAAPAAAPVAETDEELGGGDASDETQALGDGGASADAAARAADPPAADLPVDEAPPADDAPAAHTPPDDGADAPPAAPPPGSQQLAGAVVASAADGEGFVLAARDGQLMHVHASGCGVAPGDDLHLRARQLANGTWTADRVRRMRRAADADGVRVAGTVVWADPAAGRYALGARGVTLLVNVPPPPAAPPPTAPADSHTQPVAAPPVAVPALGSRLLVRVASTPAHDGQPAALVEHARRDAPPAADPAAPVPPLELAGVVQSADAQTHTLVLALDPDAQPPLTVTLSVPPQVDLARLLPAQRIAVTATAAADGTLALSGLSGDGDALAADDASALQGDQAPAHPPRHGEDGDHAVVVSGCTSLHAPQSVPRTSRR